MQLFTQKGYNLFEVASCLQKAIRRSDAELAGYMACEMFASGFGLYCWKRLLTVSAEDVGGVITLEIKALFDSWMLLTKDGKEQRSRIFLSKAVLLLCAARKNRDADHLQNYIYDREMLDAEKLDAAIQEARLMPEKVTLPEYTFDCHTRRGKKAGKTKDQFFAAEFEALQPREPGLFDWVVTGTNPNA
jgi:replication-associated recombination protein RarA